MDNPNIYWITPGSMNIIVPTYALYGEHGHDPLHDDLHCESIPQRSQLYDWEIKPHRHESFMQILYIRSGIADIRFDQRRFSVSGPCVLYVPARHIHGYHFSSDVDGAVITAVTHQLETLLARHPYLQSCFAQPQHIAVGAPHTDRLPQTLEHLLREFDDGAAWRMAMLESLLHGALILLAREIGALTRQEAQGGDSRSLRHVQRFKTLLNQTFREQRGLAFYAEQLGITTTQLNRVCRAELGRSALGVVNDRLVTEARRDLVYSSLSVKEIALTLGFSDPAYFSRFFTRQTGTAPSDFRAQALRRLDVMSR